MLLSSQEASRLIAEEWSAVRLQQERVRIHLVAGIHMGGWVMTQVQDDIYALLLPFGYSVLEKALLHSKEEGRFSCSSSQLWPMMVASRSAITWQDFGAIDTGRKARNALAHERVVPTSAVTFQALAAIERELIGWHVLPAPVVHNPQIRVG